AIGLREEAAAEYDAALALAPGWPERLNKAARRLVLDEAPKQGPIAPTLALIWSRQCCQATGNQTPELLDTLAAAYAANGQFEKAAATAAAGARHATAQGNSELARVLHERQQLYGSKRPLLWAGAGKQEKSQKKP